MGGAGWLFGEPPLQEVPDPVWVRYAGSLGKLNTVHSHVPSGWQVHHCGHPTANFPYYILKPDGETVLNPDNGRGFQRLELAKSYVEKTCDCNLQS